MKIYSQQKNFFIEKQCSVCWIHSPKVITSMSPSNSGIPILTLNLNKTPPLNGVSTLGFTFLWLLPTSMIILINLKQWSYMSSLCLHVSSSTMFFTSTMVEQGGFTSPIMQLSQCMEMFSKVNNMEMLSKVNKGNHPLILNMSSTYKLT